MLTFALQLRYDSVASSTSTNTHFLPSFVFKHNLMMATNSISSACGSTLSMEKDIKDFGEAYVIDQ